MENSYRSNLAVVLVDMQDFFLKRLSVDSKESIIANQKVVLDFCATNNIAVISLEYAGRGGLTETLKKVMRKIPTAQVIKKENNSGFTKTQLTQVLEKMGVKYILLMGINASGCVQDTAIGAIKRGFKIFTSETVIASSSKRDGNLATSKKWYSRKGLFFKTTNELLEYLKVETQEYKLSHHSAAQI